MSNIVTRAITGIIFVSILTGAVWYNATTASVLFLVIGIAGKIEYNKLVGLKESLGQQILQGLTLAATWILFHLNLTAFIIPLLVFLFALELVRFVFTDSLKIESLSKSITGFIYVNLAFFALISVGTTKLDYNAWPILMIFFMVWANDTGAYLVGKFLGKHKMIEKISPKKTWEGTIGGLIIAAAVGYLVSGFVLEINPLIYAFAGILTGLAATLGDLFESKLKRSAGVKDSGNILPGHGGILDRFDALYLAAPINYLLLTFFV